MGWGIVEEDGAGGLRMVDYGALTTPKTMPFPLRLQSLYEGVTDIIARYHPDTAGVEELFFAKNVTTAISVSHARGVVLLALANAGLPVGRIPPDGDQTGGNWLWSCGQSTNSGDGAYAAWP